jgi:CheY-like chemotaxis protein
MATGTKPGAHVLLVEDSPDDVALFRRAVKKAGLQAELVVAGNFQEALSQLDSGMLPTLVITDSRMEGINGAEMVQALRARKELTSVPLVVFSGVSYEADIQGLYDAGANSVVLKPVEFEEHQQAVVALVQKWVVGSGSE